MNIEKVAQTCEPCDEGKIEEYSNPKSYEGVVMSKINGLTEVSRCYRDLLEPIAKYALTLVIRQNAPRIASGQKFSSKVAYVDIATDVGKTEPAIEGMTAIYDDKIITSMRDYNIIFV